MIQIGSTIWMYVHRCTLLYFTALATEWQRRGTYVLPFPFRCAPFRIKYIAQRLHIASQCTAPLASFYTAYSKEYSTTSSRVRRRRRRRRLASVLHVPGVQRRMSPFLSVQYYARYSSMYEPHTAQQAVVFIRIHHICTVYRILHGRGRTVCVCVCVCGSVTPTCHGASPLFDTSPRAPPPISLCPPACRKEKNGMK